MATTTGPQSFTSAPTPSPVQQPHVEKPLPAPTHSTRADFLQQRLVSLDVYRGLIMITLAFVGFGLADTARLHLSGHFDEVFWQGIYHQAEHQEWVGCGYWDLIQPSFMFMVGMAIPFSYARRKQQGATWGQNLRHAVVRSVVLIFLGIFLISNGSRHTQWSLMNVLTQIGLGYTVLFLLWDRPVTVQALAATALLVGTYLLYTLYPATGIDLATGAPDVGVTARWAQENLEGIAPAWQKNVNVGHAIDVYVLNWLPQQTPFKFNRGGYQTINFIPELATMIFGLMCGELMRSRARPENRLRILLTAGLAGIGAGLLLDYYGICPLVKRIWTPSWTLYSTGWCCLILAGLYAVVDVLRWRWWTFPLVVVGVNSIAIYVMSMLMKGWAADTLRTHFGRRIFSLWGTVPAEFIPMVQACLVGLTFWLACLWMYRQKIFVRI